MGRPTLPPKQYTLAASAARAATASFTGTDQHNPGYTNMAVMFDVTVDPASASLTLSIQAKDLTSGDYKTLLSSAAVTGVTTGPNIYRVGTGCETVSNVSLHAAVPDVWRVIVVGADTDSMTYSVSVELTP